MISPDDDDDGGGGGGRPLSPFTGADMPASDLTSPAYGAGGGDDDLGYSPLAYGADSPTSPMYSLAARSDAAKLSGALSPTYEPRSPAYTPTAAYGLSTELLCGRRQPPRQHTCLRGDATVASSRTLRRLRTSVRRVQCGALNTRRVVLTILAASQVQ